MGRVRADGNSSGERFRDDFLIPALKSNDVVEILLDEAEGYGSSFLDEAFGGLIRKGYTMEELKKKLIVRWVRKAHFAMYVSAIWRYITDEDTRTKAKKKEALPA